MNTRIYNKIYVPKNRELDSKSINLGYQYDENELTLFKDTETYFRIPLFTIPVALSATDLISNGAFAATFPAAADRVFKSQKGYGEVTPYGNSTIVDGMWFCSWLYKNPQSGKSIWMDRYYQPGKFSYNNALNDLFDKPQYVPNNPIFKDLPSKMVFEPGVLYRYFHVGEQTAKELLTTFEGKDRSRLKMHLSNWGASSVDKSLNNLNVSVTTNAEQPLTIYSSAVDDGVRIFESSLDFENEFAIEAKIDYSKNYLFENEFTWTFWGYSEDWQSSQSTQLIGNLSTKGGGIGVFIETLDTYPFVAIPETNYGHVIFMNQNGSSYLDKSVQTQSSSITPTCFAIDSNNHIVMCNKEGSGMIYKMDHSGYVLKTTKNQNDPTTSFVFPLSGEIPKQVLCGLNDDVFVVTNQAVHLFDTNLQYKNSIGIAGGGENTIVAFRYNSMLGTALLDISTNVLDVKYEEEIKWSISSIDRHLYKDNSLYVQFLDQASTLSIGPDKNIWVTHGTNKITIIHPETKQIINKFEVGSSTIPEGLSRKFNLSFIKKFDRKTNTKEWNFLVFYSDEKLLYFYNLPGKLNKVVDLTTTFDAFLLQKLKQNIEMVKFESVGDFTGYERQRIFNQLPPYSGASQICIKASVKDTSKKGLIYSCPVKGFASIKDWEKDSWKHITLMSKNKTLFLYDNEKKIIELKLRGQDQLNFDSQPSFYIGTPTGNTFGFNKEVKWISNIFNGKIGDIRIFDYALNPYNLEFFENASTVSENLIWPLPIPSAQYVEQIERFFKHKLPGAKSQFFKLKLSGTGITNPVTQKIVEKELLNLVESCKPAYTDLIKIEWVE